MKVCFCTRSDWRIRPGGDLVQATKTAEVLAKHGLDTCFAGNPAEIPSDCDLLHLFNLTRISDSLAFSDYAITNGVPYVLSPIWHSLDEMSDFYSSVYKRVPIFNIRLYLALKEPLYYRASIQVLLRSVFGWANCVREVVSKAAMILPNSPEELACLYRDIGVSNLRHNVVPNGVAHRVDKAPSIKQRTIVVSGRVEPRKNQVSIIKAFQRTKAAEQGYKLKFVGKKSFSHAGYIKEFEYLVQSDKRLEYLGELSFDNVQDLFSQSQVVVLASFFETTGLVILEGLINGCQAVMTQCSYNDYYYGDSVYYCDPFSIRSISEAVDCAVFSPILSCDDRLDFFTWENAGLETLSAYRSVLSDNAE